MLLFIAPPVDQGSYDEYEEAQGLQIAWSVPLLSNLTQAAWKGNVPECKVSLQNQLPSQNVYSNSPVWMTFVAMQVVSESWSEEELQNIMQWGW